MAINKHVKKYIMFKINLIKKPEIQKKFTNFHFRSGTFTYKFTKYNPITNKYDLIMTNGGTSTWSNHSTDVTIQQQINSNIWTPLTEEEISKLNY